ncbi:MAG TPA: hypothetical protein VFH95_02600 [Candidatus Kapabacteria bacterium]|nr:hypothetical protein [Candidatus Kapabacteria bacterium]
MAPTTASSTPSRPEEELQFIRKILDESRARFAQSGEPYIVWGLIIAIGMGVTYLSLILQRDLYTAYVWFALILFGWGSMIYFYRKRRKEEAGSKSIIDKIDTAVWTACGGSIGLLVIMFMLSDAINGYDPNLPNLAAINPLFICFLSAMIIGIAFFISGTVNQIPWLRNTAFAWWASSVTMMVFSSSIHVIGLYALMLILFQVVPGIILQRRYRRIVAASSTEA